MIVSLREYAAQYGKSGDMMRRFAERGTLKTARKIGRNWVVDSDEPYPVRMRKEKTSRPRFSVVSLFSGCGGMDLGFLGGFDFLGTHYGKTGFDIVWANELDHNACKTYRRNFGDDYLVEGDINEQMDSLPETADIVIGGFPCQDISINGKMLGIKGKRSSLYTAIVETVQRIQPKMFIAENVGGLLMKKNEYSLNKILDDFNSLGYNISYQLYNAADYGVPQTRERIFIVGTRSDVAAFCPPKPLNSEPITARMARYQEALAINYELPEANLKIGLAYVFTDNYERAVVFFTKELQISPKMLEAYLMRGACYEQLHRYKEAKRDFEKAYDLNPNDERVIKAKKHSANW